MALRSRKVSRLITNDQVENAMVYYDLIHESQKWFGGPKSSNTLIYLIILLWASRRDCFTIKTLMECLGLTESYTTDEIFHHLNRMCLKYGLLEYETHRLAERKINNFYLSKEGRKVAMKISEFLDPIFTANGNEEGAGADQE